MSLQGNYMNSLNQSCEFKINTGVNVDMNGLKGLWSTNSKL